MSLTNVFCSLWWVPEYLAFSDSTWKFKHPETLYAWDGACVWIPCTYNWLKGGGHTLDNLTVYHNFTYDKEAKHHKGTILYYKNLKATESTPSQERVRFLGNNRNNCTLLINPVKVNDSGLLGLRVTSGLDKWMESIALNISGKALRMGPFVSARRKVGKHPTPGNDHKLCCLQRPDEDARETRVAQGPRGAHGKLECGPSPLLEQTACHSAPVHSRIWLLGCLIFPENMEI